MNTESIPAQGTGGEAGKPMMVVERTFIEKLPEELREEERLVKFKDVAGLAKSYLNLESMLGRDRLAIPEDGDEEGWNRLWQRLGRPESAEGYDLGKPEEQLPGLLTEDHLRWFRELAHKWGLNPRQARGMFQEYVSRVRAGVEEENRMLASFQEEQKREVRRLLQETYGPAAEEKMGLLDKVIRHFGGDDLRRYLEEEGNFDPRLVGALVRVGERLGEDTLTGGLSHQQMAESERARKEISRLQGDKDFQAAYHDKSHPNHDNSVEQMSKLFAAAHQEG